MVCSWNLKHGEIVLATDSLTLICVHVATQSGANSRAPGPEQRLGVYEITYEADLSAFFKIIDKIVDIEKLNMRIMKELYLSEKLLLVHP